MSPDLALLLLTTGCVSLAPKQVKILNFDKTASDLQKSAATASPGPATPK